VGSSGAAFAARDGARVRVAVDVRAPVRDAVLAVAVLAVVVFLLAVRRRRVATGTSSSPARR
jgi:hypothetical protein